jgi:putative ABC transport system permease protein
LLTQQDDTAKNANPVAVLSYGYWKTRFAASRDAIGQTVLINGHPFTILGVAPENFDSAIGGYKPGVFIPISMVEIAMPWMAPRDDLNNHQSIWLTLVARLKPGVSASQAEASLGPLWHSLRAYELTLYKSSSEHSKSTFSTMRASRFVDDSTGFSPRAHGELKTPLIVLMSMAGLLVAMCAINVATLLLLRAAGRAREMSMRYALGAKRSRIVSQLLVEGGLLGIFGAAAGLALAPLVAKTSCAPDDQSSDPGQEPLLIRAGSMRVCCSSLLGLSLVTGLLFSLAPGAPLSAPRSCPGFAPERRHRIEALAAIPQSWLWERKLRSASCCLAERASSFALSITSAISLSDSTPLILRPSRSIPQTPATGEDRTAQIVTIRSKRCAGIPGTAYVAGHDRSRTSRRFQRIQFHCPRVTKPAEDENMHFETPWVTPGYFATLRQPLLAGREFTSADVHGQPKVAIINMAVAKRFYGSPQNALGRLNCRRN